MSNALSFIDQSQGADNQLLASENFTLAVIDADSSALTAPQIAALQASGKTLLGYVSVGEAETYRSFWNPAWSSNPPSFLMGADPAWPGDYKVKYWDPAWQKIVLNEVTAMAKAGYNGIMMDVVAAYEDPQVANADGGLAKAVADMGSFIEKISATAKAINPNFKIVPNGGLENLTTDSGNPNSAPNSAYLKAIDGVLIESVFTMPDNSKSSDIADTVAALKVAQAAGKSVVDIEYPTDPATQVSAVKQALAAGFVPYISDLSLDQNVAAVNYTIPAQLPANALSSIIGTGTNSGTSGTGTGTGTSGTGTSGTGTSGTGTTDGGPSSDGNSDDGSTDSVSAAPPVVTHHERHQTITAGSTLSLAVAGNFTDPQNQTLTFEAHAGDDAALPSWLSFDSSTGNFSGTAPATAGTVKLTVTATDSSGLSVSDHFKLSVDAPPVVVPSADQTMTIGQNNRFHLPSDTFKDPQHQDLTLTATLSDGTALPSWLHFKPGRDSFSGTPPTGGGDLKVTVTATDDAGLSASDSFTIHLVGVTTAVTTHA